MTAPAPATTARRLLAAYEQPGSSYSDDKRTLHTFCLCCGDMLTARLANEDPPLLELDCPAGCSSDEITAAYAASRNGDGNSSAPLDLSGSPMDPAAVAVEPLPPLPGFPFLHEGAGALISGPTGGGRSSLVQAGAYDAARGGLRVAYLGSEVTEPEFNARAADLASRRSDPVDDALREQLAHVRYLNLASAIAAAWERPDQWRDQVLAHFDVVILDPLSAVASALDLDFDKSNAEFVRFYDRLVQPLATAGVAVVLLDNIGHALEARSRAKGASAKQDRADLTFSCKLRAQPLGLIVTAHKVRTVRASFRRGDSWTFDRDTQRIQRSEVETVTDERSATFRPTVLMERVSRAIEAKPGLTRRALRTAVQGNHDAKDLALELLVAEGYVDPREEGKWATHHSLKPYREDDKLAPWPQGGPKPAPRGQSQTGPKLAPLPVGVGPLGPQGPGDQKTGAKA